MKHLIAILALAFVLGGCSAARPEGGGLTESEFQVITALVRSGADVGCDQVKQVGDAYTVTTSLRTVSNVLDGGDFTDVVNALQEQLNLTAGTARAALNAIMAFRAIIPAEALESQHIDIFGAGVDECVLLLETKFPELEPNLITKARRAMGL